MNRDDLPDQIKKLIVETLMLDDVQVEQVGIDTPLFIDGLGLDSIDGLELGMALSRKYGLTIDSSDERNRERFATVGSIALWIEEGTASHEESS